MMTTDELSSSELRTDQLPNKRDTQRHPMTIRSFVQDSIASTPADRKHLVTTGVCVLATILAFFMALVLIKNFYLKHRRIQSIHHPPAMVSEPGMEELHDTSAHRPFDPSAFEGLITLGSMESIEKRAVTERHPDGPSGIIVGLLGSPMWETRMVREMGEHRWRQRRETRSRSLPSRGRGPHSLRTTHPGSARSSSMGDRYARSAASSLSRERHTYRRSRTIDSRHSSMTNGSASRVLDGSQHAQQVSIDGDVFSGPTVVLLPSRPSARRPVMDSVPETNAEDGSDKFLPTSPTFSFSESFPQLPYFPSPPTATPTPIIVAPVIVNPHPIIEKPSEISVCLTELEDTFKRLITSFETRAKSPTEVDKRISLPSVFDEPFSDALPPSLLLKHEIPNQAEEELQDVHESCFSGSESLAIPHPESFLPITGNNETEIYNSETKGLFTIQETENTCVDNKCTTPAKTPKPSRPALKTLPFQISNRQLNRVYSHVPYPLVAPPPPSPAVPAIRARAPGMRPRAKGKENRTQLKTVVVKVRDRDAQMRSKGKRIPLHFVDSAKPAVSSPLCSLAFSPGSTAAALSTSSVTPGSVPPPDVSSGTGLGNDGDSSLPPGETPKDAKETVTTSSNGPSLVAADDQLVEDDIGDTTTSAPKSAGEHYDVDGELQRVPNQSAGNEGASDLSTISEGTTFTEAAEIIGGAPVCECVENVECHADIADASPDENGPAFGPRSFWKDEAEIQEKPNEP
ncbi:hypothetical protein BD410DRAFT_794871 [Rickenella mellea]|uniref:Uncharacterized protein n=1 Tax=Rickenella mellea TaxID=50990 RepID=A0A4Y7PQR7_9AGAM|nr:hypothetical protein BD410DRAFT_794871 [Rickenella mellea]